MANTPTHDVYQVRDASEEGGKGFWTKIGAAWLHKDRKGLSVTLEAVPLDGRLVLREHGEKPSLE